MERLTGYRTPAVNPYMHAVYEHYRVVTLKTALQPRAYLCSDTIDHPADTGLGIVPAINLIKDISDLFLRKPFWYIRLRPDGHIPPLDCEVWQESGDENCHGGHGEYGIPISYLDHRHGQDDSIGMLYMDTRSERSIRHGGSGNVRRLTATGHRQASCLCECLRYGDGSRIVGATIIYCGTALSPNKRNLPGFFPVS